MSQECVSEATFQLYNSYCVELVAEMFNQRLNRVLAFVLFVLGGSIAVSFKAQIYGGLLVAFISGLQITYKFGERAGKSKAQKARYDELIHNRGSMSEKSLSSKLATISRSDSSVPGWMRAVGQKKACIMLGEDTDLVLTRWQRFLATISGAGPLTDQTS